MLQGCSGSPHNALQSPSLGNNLILPTQSEREKERQRERGREGGREGGREREREKVGHHSTCTCGAHSHLPQLYSLVHLSSSSLTCTLTCHFPCSCPCLAWLGHCHYHYPHYPYHPRCGSHGDGGSGCSPALETIL